MNDNIPPLPGFDLIKGRKLRDDGKEIAAQNKWMVLQVARQIALHLGRKGRLVCIDDVQEELVKLGLQPHDLGMAAGSVFNRKTWEAVGYRQSARESNHARPVTVWRQKERR